MSSLEASQIISSAIEAAQNEQTPEIIQQKTENQLIMSLIDVKNNDPDVSANNLEKSEQNYLMRTILIKQCLALAANLGYDYDICPAKNITEYLVKIKLPNSGILEWTCKRYPIQKEKKEKTQYEALQCYRKNKD